MLDYSELSMSNPEDDWFEACMKVRENAYDEIFGESDPPNVIGSPENPDLALNWPGGGVFCFPPSGKRQSWHYITHNLSQPLNFEDFTENFNESDLSERSSGFGVEIAISTMDQEEWPYQLLLLVVGYMLESGRTIYPGHRLPCSDLMTASSNGHVLAVVSTEYETEILFPCGRCQLVHLIGVTGAEIERAKLYEGIRGSEILAKVIQHYGLGYNTDRDRLCLTHRPDFDDVWTMMESNTP